jgi:hypothetical protein
MQMGQPADKAERNAQIYSRRNEGLTLAAIALFPTMAAANKAGKEALAQLFKRLQIGSI